MDRRTKATQNRDKAIRLKEAWQIEADQVRYSNNGNWYATLVKFPAALLDANGYVVFTTEEEYRTSPYLRLGKEINVRKPGISGIPGYVRVLDSDQSPPTQDQDAVNDLGSDRPERKVYSGTSYERDPNVRKAVEIRAKGKCELCDRQGFARSDGSRYLETHHIIALAKDGADRISNVIALCANHHREAHFGALRDKLEKEMITKVAEHNSTQ